MAHSSSVRPEGLGRAVTFAEHGHARDVSPALRRAADAARRALCAGDVVFGGRVIGKLVKGVYVTTKEWECADGVTELAIDFSADGMMSIAACQALLRRLVLVCPVAGRGTRTVEIVMQIGPTVNGFPEFMSDVEIPDIPEKFDCVLREKLAVRHGPALITIPEKHATVDYRENSGHTRLALFELVQDKTALVENYNSGFLLVEILQGNNEDDSLALREEDQLRLVASQLAAVKKPTARERIGSALGRLRASQTQTQLTGGGSAMGRAVASVLASRPHMAQSAVLQRSPLPGLLAAGRGTEQSLAAASAASTPAGAPADAFGDKVVTPGQSPTATPRGGRVRPSLHDVPRAETVAMPTPRRSPSRTNTAGDAGFSAAAFQQRMITTSAATDAEVQRDASEASREGTGDPPRLGEDRVLPVASITGSRGGSVLRDRMRDRVTKEVRDKKLRTDDLLATMHRDMRSMLKERIRGTDRSPQPAQAYDLFLGASEKPLAEMKRVGNGVLYFKFRSEGKGEPVTRKHVQTVLRNLTYANNSSDPQVLKKVVRVTLSDTAPATSQCIVEINIQPVDDVTEIVLRSTKVRYTPLEANPHDPSGPFFLCPFGHARLEDADTDFFDGGHLSVQAVAGGAKGDQLGFVAHPPRAGAAAGAQTSPTHGADARRHSAGQYCTGESFPLRVSGDGKKIFLPPGPDEPAARDQQVASLEYTSDKASGAIGLKVSFAKSAGQKLISLNLASYMLNCITFANPSEPAKAKSSTRTYLLKISDGENPTEGRIKLQVDSVPPLCVFQPQGVFSVDMTYKAGATDWLSVFDGGRKLTLFFPGQDAPGKPPVITQGTLSVTIEDAERSDDAADDRAAAPLGAEERDSLQFGAQGGFAVKDGGLFAGTSFLAKVEQTPQSIALECTWASKGTAKHLQQALRSVQYRWRPGPDARACRRVVRVRVAEKASAPPHSCAVVVDLIPPAAADAAQ